MEKVEIMNVILKLINETINGRIPWFRISSNIDIYSSENIAIRNFILNSERGMYLYDNDYSSGKFDLNNSYLAHYKGGNIYIFKFYTKDYGEYYYLALQSNPKSNLRLLNEIDMEELEMQENYDLFVKFAELALYASETIDETDNFISKILDEEDER